MDEREMRKAIIELFEIGLSMSLIIKKISFDYDMGKRKAKQVVEEEIYEHLMAIKKRNK